MVLAPVQGTNATSLLAHPNTLNFYPFLPSHAGIWWAEGVQRASVVQVFSPIPRLPRKQQNSANDMLSIRDQFREKVLERVREELGDFCSRESWEISGGGAPSVGMKGSQPTSLVTLNKVSNLFTSDGDVASVLVYILCLPPLFQT